MLTTVMNTLILLRILGLRLAHEAGWDGFGPLIIGLAVSVC
jgi:predicted Kef-type K+ transport protein